MREVPLQVTGTERETLSWVGTDSFERASDLVSSDEAWAVAQGL